MSYFGSGKCWGQNSKRFWHSAWISLCEQNGWSSWDLYVQCTLNLWFTRCFFGKPAPWDPQNIKRKIAVKWFFFVASTMRIRSITPRRYLYVKPCRFLALFIIFLLGLFPRPVPFSTQKSSATGATTSKRSVPIPWATLIPAAGSAKVDPRCWHENSWWIGTDALADDGSSEQFFLRRIIFFNHENYWRIFEWNIFGPINISFRSHGCNLDLHFILNEARWLKAMIFWK